MNIRDYIARLHDLVLPVATVYAMLDRLEKDGLIAARLGAVTHTRGGRKKKRRFRDSSGRFPPCFSLNRRLYKEI